MVTDFEETARAAGLRYVDDRAPGIRRARKRSHFHYFAADGKEITNERELERIRKLAIPPAYESVWICPLSNGHIQATGRDARGRKQYRYHAAWREVRDANKYAQTIAFARALPAIRERVERDLGGGDARERLLAAIVRLLEATHIRVGNDEYARSNESYGLTTLRADHVRVRGSTVRFEFRGKSGVAHAIALEDRRLSKIVRRCQDLPGEELFTYIEDDGEPVRIRSDDVNAYIREIAGPTFSAKDFRTWHGTVACALELERIGPASSLAEAKRRLKAALTVVASELGNTPAVCRKCYVHPAIAETYLDELALELPKARPSRARGAKARTALDPNERRVVAYLESHATRTQGKLARALQRSLEGSSERRRRVKP